MKKRKKNLSKIDSSWTLFIDRDGIVNKMIKGGYVLKWSEFKFIPDFLRSISGLSMMFGRVIIVTNQRCVAKGLLTRSELKNLHKKMLDKITMAGGRIDKIYYCPHDHADKCKCRKPKTGMALKAKKDIKSIDLKKSVMLGDSLTDMEFGKKAGMTTVLITKDRAMGSSPFVDHCFTNADKFYSLIKSFGDL